MTKLPPTTFCPFLSCAFYIPFLFLSFFFFFFFFFNKRSSGSGPGSYPQYVGFGLELFFFFNPYGISLFYLKKNEVSIQKIFN